MFKRWFASEKRDYHTLPSDSEEEEASPITSEQPPKLGPWLVAICVLCTTVNLTLSIAFPPNVAPHVRPPIARDEIHLLRRPSQYIRLDEVIRPSPPVPKDFTNYPMLLAPIDKSRANEVFGDDPRRYMSHVGTISPEDRRVLVSETASTIIQFRAIDYGMEICELHIVLPSSPKNRTSQRFLSLFRLNAPIPLSAGTLSYNTRPPRLFKLADIPITGEGDIHWHRQFTCHSDEVLSYELACMPSNGNGQCYLEWWQDKESDNPKPGLYITQHSTI